MPIRHTWLITLPTVIPSRAAHPMPYADGWGHIYSGCPSMSNATCTNLRVSVAQRDKVSQLGKKQSFECLVRMM